VTEGTAMAPWNGPKNKLAFIGTVTGNMNCMWPIEWQKYK